jgi:hypothetical protein
VLPDPAADAVLPDPAADAALPDPAADAALPDPAADAALPDPAADAAFTERAGLAVGAVHDRAAANNTQAFPARVSATGLAPVVTSSEHPSAIGTPNAHAPSMHDNPPIMARACDRIMQQKSRSRPHTFLS